MNDPQWTAESLDHAVRGCLDRQSELAGELLHLDAVDFWQRDSRWRQKQVNLIDQLDELQIEFEKLLAIKLGDEARAAYPPSGAAADTPGAGGAL